MKSPGPDEFTSGRKNANSTQTLPDNRRGRNTF